MRQYECADCSFRPRPADCPRPAQADDADQLRPRLHLCRNAAGARMSWAALAILGFVTLQRLAELILSQRNTKRLLARGAYEVAPEHYPFLVLLHATWLAVL